MSILQSILCVRSGNVLGDIGTPAGVEAFNLGIAQGTIKPGKRYGWHNGEVKWSKDLDTIGHRNHNRDAIKRIGVGFSKESFGILVWDGAPVAATVAAPMPSGKPTRKATATATAKPKRVTQVHYASDSTVSVFGKDIAAGDLWCSKMGGRKPTNPSITIDPALVTCARCLKAMGDGAWVRPATTTPQAPKAVAKVQAPKPVAPRSMSVADHVAAIKALMPGCTVSITM